MTNLARLLLLGLWLIGGGTFAQAPRDPTVAPLSAMPAAAGAGGASAGAPSDAAQQPYSVIVRDGRPYLVVGTRLYTQGQMLGAARIERISETEVWLREGKTLRKRPMFAGVERRPAGTEASLPKCVPPVAKKKPSTRVSPSEICQP